MSKNQYEHPNACHSNAFRFTLILSFLTIGALILGVQPALAHKSNKIGHAVTYQTMKTMRQASMKGLRKKTSNAKDPALQAIKGQSVTSDHKTEVIYIGADYCPYCAALRWPLIMALQRFGHFKDLKYMRSSRDDVHANTPTFSFHGSEFHSTYMAFRGVEVKNRKGHTLTQPTSKENALVHKFDRPPYTRQAGAIPFLDIGGQFIEIGAPFNPKLIHGKSWKTIVNTLNSPKKHLSQRLIGVTNLFTAAICRQDGGKPKRICDKSGVKKAAHALPTHKQAS